MVNKNTQHPPSGNFTCNFHCLHMLLCLPLWLHPPIPISFNTHGQEIVFVLSLLTLVPYFLNLIHIFFRFCFSNYVYTTLLSKLAEKIKKYIEIIMVLEKFYTFPKAALPFLFLSVHFAAPIKAFKKPNSGKTIYTIFLTLASEIQSY